MQTATSFFRDFPGIFKERENANIHTAWRYQMQRKLKVLCAVLGAVLLVSSAQAGFANAEASVARSHPAAIPAATSQTVELDLSIPRTFAITRPVNQITTTLQAYYITGTSNPAAPVFFNGEEIQRLGTQGVFGVHVELSLGTNTFTFSQGNQRETVTIVRRRPVTDVVPITEIVQGSMFPAVQGGVKVGEYLEVSCTAPAGATVSTTFNGRTVQLTPVATAQRGTPTRFTGSIMIQGDFDPDSIQKVGPVTYTMNFDGRTRNFESSGDVFVAGRNTFIAVRLTSHVGFV